MLYISCILNLLYFYYYYNYYLKNFIKRVHIYEFIYIKKKKFIYNSTIDLVSLRQNLQHLQDFQILEYIKEIKKLNSNI